MKSYLIAFVVILAPIPVGGYEAWLLPVIAALTGLAMVVDQATPSREDKHGNGLVWLVFWGVVLGYGLVQTTVLQVVRDVSFYIPSATVGLEFSVIDWGRSLEFMVRFTVYVALAYLVSRLHRKEIDVVTIAILISATFQALYGLVNYAQGNPSILGLWEAGAGKNDVAGTFYSRNQLAGYLAMALPVGSAWLWSRFSGDSIGAGAKTFQISVLIFYALVIVVALIGSGSRLGVTAAIAACLFWAWRSNTNHTKSSSGFSSRWLTWPVLVLAVLAVLWFGPDKILQRFMNLSFETGRGALWANLLEIPLDVWLWGIGPGQFIDVFKLYQWAEIEVTLFRALNDYLQFALEYGLVGTALTAIIALWGLFKVAPSRFSDLQRAAMASIVAVAIHSFGDFDLRVPGTAVLAWVILGIVLKRGGYRPVSFDTGEKTVKRRRRKKRS